MILGIDASNISSGGGLNHLSYLLRFADPAKHGFSKIVIWASEATLNALDNRPWLEKQSSPVLQRGIVARSFWKTITLPKLLRRQNCDLLFVPGGSYLGGFHPFVTMSRNLLPFDLTELFRFGFSLMTLKLLLLRVIQSISFRSSDGLIFLTTYSEAKVREVVNLRENLSRVIPHGIDDAFYSNPAQEQPHTRESDSCSPLRLIYVSMIDVYKHQWRVIHAVKLLRDSGYELELELVGPSRPMASRLMNRYLSDFSLFGDFWKHTGHCQHEDLPGMYRKADICIFASSCENLPNILLEGMASGLPIACSNRGPMPEILQDGGVFFDPNSEDSIFKAIKELLDSVSLRQELAKRAYNLSQQYSWSRCAEETFAYLEEIAQLSAGSKR